MGNRSPYLATLGVLSLIQQAWVDVLPRALPGSCASAHKEAPPDRAG